MVEVTSSYLFPFFETILCLFLVIDYRAIAVPKVCARIDTVQIYFSSHLSYVK